jgi:hypothetical protein
VNRSVAAALGIRVNGGHEVRSYASTVDEYLAGLSADRRAALEAVRETILAHLPPGFEEGMQYGMISYHVPLDHFANPSNGQPVGLAALASQKRYLALYLGCYGDPGEAKWLRERWTATGRKLDMGKSCIRFRRLDDVPLDVVGEAIARTSVEDVLARHERTRR